MTNTRAVHVGPYPKFLHAKSGLPAVVSEVSTIADIITVYANFWSAVEDHKTQFEQTGVIFAKVKG